MLFRLVPASIASWYLVLAAGLFAHSYVEQNLCPAQDLISGFCDNRLIQTWLNLLIHACASLSALAVEVSAVSLAPNHKEWVAWATLMAGLSAAAYLAGQGLKFEGTLFGMAALGGLIGAWASVRYVRKQPSPSLHRQKS